MFSNWFIKFIHLPVKTNNDAINCLLQNSTHRTHPSVFLHHITAHPKWRLMKLMMMEMRRRKIRKIRTSSRIVPTNVNFAINPFLAWATWRSMSRWVYFNYYYFISCPPWAQKCINKLTSKFLYFYHQIRYSHHA
jgi:hypothetical protein